MSRQPLVIFLLSVGLAVAGRTAGAQQLTPAQEPAGISPADQAVESYQTPPAIRLVEGAARLERQGQSQAAVANMPLVEGDRIATDGGRVAVTFPDGSLLHIDNYTTVDFLSLSLMRLLRGRVIFIVAGQGGGPPSLDYQIDAPAGSVQVQRVGEYHVSTLGDADSPEVELRVVTGGATLSTDRGSVALEPGERSFARPGAQPAYPQSFNAATLDAFDQWSEAERQENLGTQSAEYLPTELDTYSGVFDQNGSWEDVEPYGNVWYPTVSAGWQPYYNGYWDYVGPYGWTWIGYDAWAWPTYHFGRWGIRAGRWFWVPGTVWGPAWVSWGFSTGYLGWCPLDFYNRPIVNIFAAGFWNRDGVYGGRHGWVVIPRHALGTRERVARYAVSETRLRDVARTGFAVERRPPAGPASLSRGGSGDRLVVGTAVPRALSATPRSVSPGRGSLPLSGSRAEAAGAAPRAAVQGSSAAPAPAVRRQGGYVSRAVPEPPPGAATGSRAGAASQSGAVARQRNPESPYENRPPGASRSYATAPGWSAVPRREAPPSTAAQPRSPAQSRTAPGWGAPAERPAPETYARPRYSPQTAPGVYRAPSTPGAVYGTPRVPQRAPAGSNTPPGYSSRTAPQQRSVPRYSAPVQPRAIPRSSAPVRAAPRPAAPSRVAPRSAAPARSAPSRAAAPRASAPSRSAPARSGGGRGRGRGGRS